jgi:predicted permease
MEGFDNSNPVYVRDRTYAEGEIPQLRRYKFISPGSFRTFGTPILAGRDYDWTDVYELRPVAIVSESLAREVWGDVTSALGRFVRPLPNSRWREIVGVVGDVSDDGVDEPQPPTVYWPAYNEGFFGPDTAVGRGNAYLIRSNRAGTEAFLDELRQAVRSIGPGLPLALVRTLGDVYQASLARTSYTLVLLAIAGAMALLLGVVGIYGVVAYAVAQRTREVGIRMALGAERGGVQGLFVRRALLLVAIGSAIGLAAAAGATRLMSSLLFGVNTLDPVTYAGVAVVIGMSALVAAYLPARRASRVDPLVALRTE